ncbi:hypothetical protein [Burkholderia pyrrocinia]|uniref:hypothetical protein n=1 Tax=Burkholderia pyrrocinia TaxID=60550 RepID=UPI002AAF23D3|nr:hypothetical protein [Burkholderia pyrrocinia]
MNTENFFLRQAMKIVTRQPAPDRIPLSTPRIYQRDYFSATIRDLHGGVDVLVRGAGNDGIHADAWEGGPQRYQRPVRIDYDEGSRGKIELIYYLRQYEFRSSKSRSFVISVWFGGYRLKAWWDDFRQGRYNRRTIERRRRMEVLRTLLEHSINAPTQPLTPWRLLTQQLGDGWIFHPTKDVLLNQVQFTLRAFAEEGLARVGNDPGEYHAAARAMTVMDEYDTDERRHLDNRKIQRILAVFGLLALVAAGVQAVASVKQAWYAEPTTVVVKE